MKQTITYFRDKNHKSKKKYKIFKTITSTLELFDTVVNTGATTTSVTLSVTGVGLLVFQFLLERFVLHH